MNGEIKLNIRKTRERDFSTNNNRLITEKGSNFTLQQVDGFIPMTEINERARENAVMVTMPVVVTTQDGTFRSKGPLRVLFAHAHRDNTDQHVALNAEIPSEELVNAVVKHLEKNEPDKERLKLIVSCDSNNPNTLRWDQGPVGARLGIIGFSGAANHAQTRAADQSLHITLDDDSGVNPFTNQQHPLRHLVQGVFTFTTNKKRISIP